MKHTMQILRWGLSILLAALFLIPFYILINVSFRSPSVRASYWMPSAFTYLENFINAWTEAGLGRAFINSGLITLGVLAGIVVMGSGAAYPLSRLRTRLNRALYYIIVACLIVPPLTILVPLYIMIVRMFGSSTYASIVFPLIAYQLPLAVFLYTTFIGTVPRELDEAAMIDGCTPLLTFWRIIFPLMTPVTASVLILVGVNAWNDFAFSVFFLQRSTSRNFTVALGQFFSQFSNQIHWVAAGCLMGLLPITVLYLVLQRYFISGLASGAVKG